MTAMLAKIRSGDVQLKKVSSVSIYCMYNQEGMKRGGGRECTYNSSANLYVLFHTHVSASVLILFFPYCSCACHPQEKKEGEIYIV